MWPCVGDGSNSFSVKAIRSLIVGSSTNNVEWFHWVNWIPFKINCFVWRLFKNKFQLITINWREVLLWTRDYVSFVDNLMKIWSTFSSPVVLLWNCGDGCFGFDLFKKNVICHFLWVNFKHSKNCGYRHFLFSFIAPKDATKQRDRYCNLKIEYFLRLECTNALL